MSGSSLIRGKHALDKVVARPRRLRRRQMGELRGRRLPVVPPGRLRFPWRRVRCDTGRCDTGTYEARERGTALDLYFTLTSAGHALCVHRRALDDTCTPNTIKRISGCWACVFAPASKQEGSAELGQEAGRINHHGAECCTKCSRPVRRFGLSTTPTGSTMATPLDTSTMSTSTSEYEKSLGVAE